MPEPSESTTGEGVDDPIPAGEDSESTEQSDELSELTVEELDHRRRTAAAELERRDRVAAGQEHVGQVAHDYLTAARVDCSYTPTELGQIIIDYITKTLKEEVHD